MELYKIIEKVNYLNNKKQELEQAIVDANELLSSNVTNRKIVDNQRYLQNVMNKVVEIRRAVNSLTQKVPDIQEDIRRMLEELEDKASLEE